MNADQLSVSVSMVLELLDQQFPQWVDRPVTEGPSAGAATRCSASAMTWWCVFPPSRIGGGGRQGLSWLPWLASQLPLSVPIPVAAGAPAEVFPRPWAVFRWIRGVGLESEIRSDIRALGAEEMVEEALATAVWDSALAAMSHRLSTWIHGDLFPMNLSADLGALSAVIDFDLMGSATRPSTWCRHGHC